MSHSVIDRSDQLKAWILLDEKVKWSNDHRNFRNRYHLTYWVNILRDWPYPLVYLDNYSFLNYIKIYKSTRLHKLTQGNLQGNSYIGISWELELPVAWVVLGDFIKVCWVRCAGSHRVTCLFWLVAMDTGFLWLSLFGPLVSVAWNSNCLGHELPWTWVFWSVICLLTCIFSYVWLPWIWIALNASYSECIYQALSINNIQLIWLHLSEFTFAIWYGWFPCHRRFFWLRLFVYFSVVCCFKCELPRFQVALGVFV